MEITQQTNDELAVIHAEFTEGLFTIMTYADGEHVVSFATYEDDTVQVILTTEELKRIKRAINAALRSLNTTPAS